MDPNTSGKCANCGTALLPDAPGGLCPLCLLKQGFHTGHPSSFVPPSPADLAGHFPGLEILEMIGRGGMGVVYKARQRDLDRIVALKILPSAPNGDPAFAERFTREARALARLSHPNIVAIHDFGERDGLFFFLMEYVDGANLRQAMQGGHLAPEQALAIVPQICDALQYAHDQGVVHRDIKPENVLMEKGGRIKIADFGLAKILAPNANEAELTQAGQFMGTTYYMAPEQVERPQTVDRRADIYSLGVVFYQMLTGELPLGRFSPPSQSVKVDVRIDEVVLRALENKPEMRFSQAGEVKTEIETIKATPGKAGKPASAAKGSRGKDRLVIRLFVLFLLPVACFAAAKTFRAWYPRDYLTTATLKISNPASIEPTTFLSYLDPRSVFSPAVLSPLLTDETFRGKTPDAALAALRKAVGIRKSDWDERALEITLQWPDAAGSRRLARAFANSFASTISKNRSAWADSSLSQLDQEIAAQRSQAEALGEELRKMPTRLGTAAGDPQDLPSLKAALDSAQTELRQAHHNIDVISRLAAEQPSPSRRKKLDEQMNAAKAWIQLQEETCSYLTARIRYLEEQGALAAAEQKIRIAREGAATPAIIVSIAEPERTAATGFLVTLPIFATILGLVAGTGLALHGRHAATGISLAAILLVAALGANATQAFFTAAPPLPKPARISIGGEVKKPQLMDYEPDLTVSRVITAAGGFTDYADRKKIRLIRDGQVIVIDGKAIGNTPSRDVPVLAGDTIEVPQSIW